MKKKLKILFMDVEIPYLLKDSNFPIGGACARIHAFSKGLTELGNRVGILTWKGANAYVGLTSNFELVETYSLDSGIRKLRWFYMRIPKLLLKTKKFHPDVVVWKSPGDTLFLMAVICLLLKIRLVFMVTNDVIADDRIINKIGRRSQLLHRLGIALSHAIFCQNQYQYNLFFKKFPKKILFKITNPYYNVGVDKKYPTERKREYVAWVGIFQYQKNLPALLRVVRRNPRLYFYIAGRESGNPDKDTKNAVKILSKCKNVKFVGYLKRYEILEFLSKAHVLLNTSRYEGFSNTFLEAFAVGTPVICLKVNPDEILTRHKLGYIAVEKDVGKIIETIINEGENNQLHRRLVEYLNRHHDYKSLSRELSYRLLDVVQSR